MVSAVALKRTILVVEDEKDIRELVRFHLEQEGYAVQEADSGEAALDQVAIQRPALVILDLMLPGTDGVEVCRRLRLHHAANPIPVIMLTARAAEVDRVLGLELGADDYVTKPFRPRELLARIRAVLRRRGESDPPSMVFQHGDLMLDREGHRVNVQGRPVDLTPSEFELLAALLSAPGRVFSRLDLLDRVQGTAYEGYQRTIDYHVKNLRAKLGDPPHAPRYIETVYGVGYRLMAG